MTCQNMLDCVADAFGVTRYDYEECDSESANKMIAHLESLIAGNAFVGKSYSSGGKTYVVQKADNFSYVDPIDNSLAKNQVRADLQF